MNRRRLAATIFTALAFLAVSPSLRAQAQAQDALLIPGELNNMLAPAHEPIQFAHRPVEGIIRSQLKAPRQPRARLRRQAVSASSPTTMLQARWRFQELPMPSRGRAILPRQRVPSAPWRSR